MDRTVTIRPFHAPTPPFQVLAPVALLVGAILLILWDLTHILVDDGAVFSAFVGTTAFYLQGGIEYGAILFLLLGLPALLHPRFGLLGRAGVLVMFLGLFLRAGLGFTNLFVAPAIAPVAPHLLDQGPGGVFMLAFLLAHLLVPLGVTLVGAAAWRRGAVDRRLAVLLVAGGVIMSPLGNLLPLSPGELLVGAGLAWWGWGAALHLKRTPPAPTPAT